MPSSNIIPATTSPTSGQLWALAYLFKHDWKSPATTRSEFSTAIQYGLTASEQRWGLLGKPRRTVTAVLHAYTRESVARLRSNVRRIGRSKFLFPVYSDQSELSQLAIVGDTIITLDTTYRRLFVGYRLVIARDPTYSPEILTFEVKTVQAISDTSITLDSPLTHTYKSGSHVYPLIECLPNFNTSKSVITDTVATIQIDGTEVAGATQLPPLQEPNTLPNGFGHFGAYPILAADEDFAGGVTTGTNQYGDFAASGIGNFPVVYGSQPSELFDFPITALNRYEACKIIRFFESRAGMLFPFYVLSPLTEYQVLSISDTTVTVTATGLENDWAGRPHIGFVTHSGIQYVRAVTFSGRSGEIDTLTISDEIPGLLLTDIRRATTAWLCRFASDQLSENWRTTELMQTTLSLRQVLKEQSVTIQNLEITESTPVSVGIPPQCGAKPTFYRADTCEGLPSNVYLLNEGQTLPFEFINNDDGECYNIPLNAVSVVLADFTIPGQASGNAIGDPPSGQAISSAIYSGFFRVDARNVIAADATLNRPFRKYDWEFVQLGQSIPDSLVGFCYNGTSTSDVTVNLYVDGTLYATTTITPVQEPSTVIVVTTAAGLAAAVLNNNVTVHVNGIINIASSMNVGDNVVITGNLTTSSTATTNGLKWVGPYNGNYAFFKQAKNSLLIRNLHYDVGIVYHTQKSPGFVHAGSANGLCIRRILFKFTGSGVQGNLNPTDVWIHEVTADVDAMQKYLAWVQGENWLINACTIENSVLEHCIRGHGWRRLCITDNYLANVGTAESGVPGDDPNKTAFRSEYGQDLCITNNTLIGAVSLHPLEGVDGLVIANYPNFATDRLDTFRFFNNICQTHDNTQIEVGHRSKNGYLKMAAGTTTGNQELIKVYGRSPKNSVHPVTGDTYPIDTTENITIDLANLPQSTNKPQKVYVDSAATDNVTFINGGGPTILPVITAGGGGTIPSSITQGPCCKEYRQLKQFCDGILVDKWVSMKSLIASGPGPYLILHDALCYKVDSTNPTSGTLRGINLVTGWSSMTVLESETVCPDCNPNSSATHKFALYQEERECPGDVPGPIVFVTKWCNSSPPQALGSLICRGDGLGGISVILDYVLDLGPCVYGDPNNDNFAVPDGSTITPKSQAEFLATLSAVALGAEPPQPGCATCKAPTFSKLLRCSDNSETDVTIDYLGFTNGMLIEYGNECLKVSITNAVVSGPADIVAEDLDINGGWVLTDTELCKFCHCCNCTGGTEYTLPRTLNAHGELIVLLPWDVVGNYCIRFVRGVFRLNNGSLSQGMVFGRLQPDGTFDSDWSTVPSNGQQCHIITTSTAGETWAMGLPAGVASSDQSGIDMLTISICQENPLP